MNLDDFLILADEPREYDLCATADGEVVLPCCDRDPNEPGYPITWTEHPRRGRPYQRSGMVLAHAPRPGYRWVVPAERRRGEGYAVLVHAPVARDGTPKQPPQRQVGTVEDRMSSAVEQARWRARQVAGRG